MAGGENLSFMLQTPLGRGNNPEPTELVLNSRFRAPLPHQGGAATAPSVYEANATARCLRCLRFCVHGKWVQRNAMLVVPYPSLQRVCEECAEAHPPRNGS